LAAHTQDDGFHEIQLNGKQLVFLFMAATVVSVVIFLCGVLVGRGVRVERATEVATELSTAEPAPQQAAAPATPTPAGSDPTAAAAPQAVDDLSYFNRLEGSNPAPEQLKAPAPPSAPAPAAKEPAPAAATSEPQGTGYVVQVAALNIRSEADAIAKRLSAKGYAAYVQAPAAGAPQIYRVRIVGKSGSRREAETMATRLEKEEQFKPWVTR
jgi:DedD protein